MTQIRLVMLGTLLVSSTSHAYKEVKVQGGTIAGVVNIGKAPPPRHTTHDKDKEVCGTSHADESYVVGGGNGLANVVVEVVGVKEGMKKAAGPQVRLDNHGCRFEPHVQAIALPVEVSYTNTDAVFHTTHAYFLSGDSAFNVALPQEGPGYARAFDEPGIYKFGCDAGHTWMSAFIFVADHPYVTVTDANGKFSLADVPPGEHTVRFWHEAAGEKTVKLKVVKGGTAAANVTY